MSRGKNKPKLNHTREAQTTLQEINELQNSIKFSAKEIAYRKANEFAAVPDRTDPEIQAALETAVANADLNLNDRERKVIENFFAGRYDFGSFLEKEYREAYIIYDSLRAINHLNGRARREALQKAGRLPGAPIKSLPTMQDYRYFDSVKRSLMNQELRDIVDQLAELAQTGEMESVRGVSLLSFLSSRKITKSNCPTLESFDRTNRIARANKQRLSPDK